MAHTQFYYKTLNFPTNLKECKVEIPETLEKLIIPDSLVSVEFSDTAFSETRLPLLTQKRLRELGYTGSFAGTRTSE